MEIQTTLCITRPSGGKHDAEYIRVQIQDKASNIHFLVGEVSLRDFMLALTGLGYVDMKTTVRGLEHVGLEKVSERRSVYCPLTGYDRVEQAKWLRDNCQEEGWLLDDHLGSQSSITYCQDKPGKILNYRVFKYI